MRKNGDILLPQGERVREIRTFGFNLLEVLKAAALSMEKLPLRLRAAT
jgi:hypothetical protein